MEDIETDDVLTRPDYLVLNETWMDSDSLVSLNNYEYQRLVAEINNLKAELHAV